MDLNKHTGSKKNQWIRKQIRLRLTELADAARGDFKISKRDVPYVTVKDCRCSVTYFWTTQQYGVFHPCSVQGEWVERADQTKQYADTITGVLEILKQKGWTHAPD